MPDWNKSDFSAVRWRT